MTRFILAAIAPIVWGVTVAAIRTNWLSRAAINATFCIGVSCGLPLYLFLRSRPA